MFFPELWALASHNEAAAQEMYRLYEKARQHFIVLIGAINPSLSVKETAALALFISASLEGQTPFIGHDRAFASRLPEIRDIAVYSILELVKNMRPADIQSPPSLASQQRKTGSA